MTPNHPRTALCSAAPPTAQAGAVLSVILVGFLCACGGGGGETRVPADTKVYPPITITAAFRVNEAHVGVPVQFEGGICGGGNSQLKALWTFGDSEEFTETNFDIQSHTHTYATAGYYPLRVRCSDTSTTTWATSSAYIQVFP